MFLINLLTYLTFDCVRECFWWCSLGVAGVALFAIIYNVPRYFESTLVWNSTENVGSFTRTTLGSSSLYTRLYFDFMYYLVGFILPLTLLAVFNCKLIMAYRQFRKKRRSLRPTQLNARSVWLVLLCGKNRNYKQDLYEVPAAWWSHLVTAEYLKAHMDVDSMLYRPP